MFAADLLKQICFNCSISFVKVSTYEREQSTGKIKHLIGLNENIKGRTIVLLEDIIDTGFTMGELIKDLKQYKPSEIKVATMFFKSECCKTKVQIDYCGIEIPDRFIVGYGLDYNNLGRNYPDVYSIINN
jgi:hypoxanthine phosphoribosyltransferase